jgi:hypothetical protein
MSPRLSDSLRGMADRAPLGEASVSAPDAIKRVKTRRAVRITANSAMGAGAAAVVAFAIIVPTIGAGGGTGDPAAAPQAQEDGAGAESLADDARLAYGFCGGAVVTQAEGQPGTLTIAGVAEEAAEGGSVPSYDVTFTASENLEGSFGAPTVFVVWDGTVVGTAYGASTEMAESSLAEGSALTTPVEVPLVNCWDGSPLPGGTYQIVASQEVFTATEPSPEEPVDVAPLDPSSAASDAPLADDSVVRFDAGYTFVSEPQVLTVAGEVPEDPFGQYLNPVMPELPEGFLTPEKARELYAASLVSGGWDMAEGTQRVLMTGDSAVTDGSLWESNYFGCAWDGAAGKDFPQESSEMALLGVSATVPAQIALSYGWVVDGNPQVDVQATNISEHVLPQLYEPNASLVLVKDGKVVAEAYLTSLNRNPDYNQDEHLEAGDIVSGEYLWRDVNGCWTNDGQLPVEPGTYTVLNQQYVYLASNAGGPVWYGDALSSKYPSGGVGTGTSGVAEPAAVAPDAPLAEQRAADLSIAPVGDYLEFQVWTSLGTVKITD